MGFEIYYEMFLNEDIGKGAFKYQTTPIVGI